MARKTSEDVFELVKSLSTSEKRYFKIFASLHTVGDKNKYLTLFDLIETQEKYDEAELIQAMDEQGGVTFSKLKKYLYDLILKALRNYNADRNGVHELTSTINDLNILFSKGLYQHSLKMLHKAQKITAQYELFSYNYLIENWKRRLSLHIDEKGSKITRADLADRVEEYEQLDQYLSAFAELRNFKKHLSAITQYEELPPAVRDVLKNKLTKDTPLKIKFFHHRLDSIAKRLLLDNEEYLELAETAFDIAQNHPSLPDEDVLTYTLEPLMEYCNALLRMHRFGEFSKMIKKATPYITASKMQLNSKGKADIEAKMNLMKSEYDRLNGRLAHKDEHMDRIRVIEDNPMVHPSEAMRNLYYWEMINWHFMSGEADMTLAMVNKLQSDIPHYQTESAANSVRWICLYEMGQTEELQNALIETKTSSILEESIRNTLSLELQNPSINHFITLKKTLKQLEKNTDKIHFKFFDFMAWVNRKLLGDDTFAPVRRQLHYYHQ